MNYYLAHPSAVDTSEGLARWRLLEEYVERTIRETEEALAWLVEREALRQIERPCGRSVFVMNPDRRDAARQFVATSETHGER